MNSNWPADTAVVMAGIPALNSSLYRRIRFLVGDPAAVIDLPAENGGRQSTLILRDIEMGRARMKARVDRVACPAHFAPSGGLSGDRETATAQATAELILRAGVRRVVADRSLPLLYQHLLTLAGLSVECDTELGVLDRRAKDEQEIAWLQEAQQATEGAMEMACRFVAQATARADGVLEQQGQPLTADSLRAKIDVWLLERGYTNPRSIVACGPQGADCHDYGSGNLLTGQPVIVDIFPRNRTTLYNGDCTRTVVHGEIHPELLRMHAAVVAAKAQATAATRPGATGEDVHHATIAAIKQHGYTMGLPAEDAPLTYCAMTHGTGHGVGLDVHEPPLLDFGGPELVVGDCLTIEPGLYSRSLGGVRVEDMVIVTTNGCMNLNQLPEELCWK